MPLALGSLATGPTPGAPAEPVMGTAAGTGAAGFNGDGIRAVEASLNSPSAVAVDSSGILYIADLNNNRIRVAK